MPLENAQLDKTKETPFSFKWGCMVDDITYPNALFYEDSEAPWEDPDDIPPVYITITNILTHDQTITIPSAEGEVDRNNNHFTLVFQPGTLISDAITIDSDGWAISTNFDSKNETLYLLWRGEDSITLFPRGDSQTSKASESVEIILSGVAAAPLRSKPSNERNSDTKLDIKWEINDDNITVNSLKSAVPGGGSSDYEETASITLEKQPMPKTKTPAIPLFVGFVDGNKVLNTGESNDLRLRITNINPNPGEDYQITFRYDQQDESQSSHLLVTLECGEFDWALSDADTLNDISVSIPKGGWKLVGSSKATDRAYPFMTWDFIPDGEDVKLDAHETILIELKDITTTHQTGETNLFLKYKTVEKYADGQFICQIEKVPLKLEDRLLKVGKNAKFQTEQCLTFNTNTDTTINDKPAVSFQRAGTELLKLDEQDNLNFGARNGDLVTLWESGDDRHSIGVQGHTTYFRTTERFGWYRQGGHDDEPLNPGVDGQVVMAITQTGQEVPFPDKESQADLHVNGRIKDLTGDVMPVGTILAYAGEKKPEGWLTCNGQSLNESDYPELFVAIGNKYGSKSDGSFNLPDLRGRLAVGLSSIDEEFKELGKIGGRKTHRLTMEEMPTHSHNVHDTGHSHSMTATNFDATSRPKSGAFYYDKRHQRTTRSVSQIAANLQEEKRGKGNEHSILQPYITLNYIIKF